MQKDLADFLRSHRFLDREPQSLADAIGEELLASSVTLRHANFQSYDDRDLEILFAAYDQTYFSGALQRALNGIGAPIRFRWSKRMTSAGGKTVRTTYRRRSDQCTFEIAISSVLLFQTFNESLVERPIPVNGLICQTRLDALQRIFEHELVHLGELLAWDDSSCTQARFLDIAGRFFGHTKAHHQLVTGRELASAQGIRPGMRVRFDHEGVVYTGRVNRITRRATVLVEDADGVTYSDGRRYVKFYVPLSRLRPSE